MNPSHLTVVGHADNFLRARDLITAVRLACGNGVPVIIFLATEDVEDLTAARWTEPLVTLVPPDSPPQAVIESITSDFVLCVPNIHVVALSGVMSALDYLKGNPETLEVGALIHGPHQTVNSGAFRVLFEDGLGGQAVGPVENLALSWDKHGPAATANADLLGGVCLVRREHLADHHLHDGSLTSRALSRVGAPTTGRAQVFSGLHTFCLDSTLSPFPPSGSAERLSEGSSARWRAAGVREVTVLHRGVGVLDDTRNHVVFCADQRIAAVDGRGSKPPADISDYYRQVSTQLQLGPAFTAATRWQAGGGGRPDSHDDFRGSIEGLTPAERIVLRAIRRLSALLPGPALRLIKKVLSRFEGGH